MTQRRIDEEGYKFCLLADNDANSSLLLHSHRNIRNMSQSNLSHTVADATKSTGASATGSAGLPEGNTTVRELALGLE